MLVTTYSKKKLPQYENLPSGDVPYVVLRRCDRARVTVTLLLRPNTFFVKRRVKGEKECPTAAPSRRCAPSAPRGRRGRMHPSPPPSRPRTIPSPAPPRRSPPPPPLLPPPLSHAPLLSPSPPRAAIPTSPATLASSTPASAPRTRATCETGVEPARSDSSFRTRRSRALSLPRCAGGGSAEGRSGPLTDRWTKVVRGVVLSNRRPRRRGSTRPRRT